MYWGQQRSGYTEKVMDLFNLKFYHHILSLSYPKSMKIPKQFNDGILVLLDLTIGLLITNKDQLNHV